MTSTLTGVDRTTRTLLACGVLAGPLYVVVSLAQASTREGFDLGRHAWSLLANGDLGWIQTANFVVTGLLVVAASVGLRRASVRGATLIGAYGLSLVGAGAFHADPVRGFPVGAPGTTTPSLHGMLHLVVGGIGFACLVAACFVLAAAFARAGRAGLAWFSRGTGVAFTAAFAGIAGGSHGPTVPAFCAAVVLSWAWLGTVSRVSA
ncbi:DUF998 domain-containing protein [Umezawaea sp. Da 62-37]|uniref:DUF998 domain-containing protein n=1 Tax=Umezawaea sp. Da 62-37 TaxID=3075927 RepID=UPI0028F745DB|nr:DUF998 domain-containing protein [Umezawaea sp. Da 62-37]WNV85830.1 DUF998 domain-containing protein [Umezawaea sp. Da 62-37]